MIGGLLDRFNRSFTIKMKILLLFIPLLFLLFIIFGEASDLIYRYYIRQLAYNDLQQRTQRLREDVEYRLSQYDSMSGYFFANERIRIILSRYNNQQDIDYPAYLEDFTEIQGILARYLEQGGRPVVYVFNPQLMVDGYYLRYLEEYPDPDVIKAIVENRGKAYWFTAAGSNRSLIVARAIYDNDDRISAILNVEISMDTLTRIFNLIDVGKNGFYEYCLTDGSRVLSSGGTMPLEGDGLFSFTEKVKMNRSVIRVGYSQELISRMGSDQRKALFAVMAVFAVLAVLLTYLFSSFTVRRMKLFIDKLNRTSTNSSIVPIEGTDEITLIDRSFNQMLLNLRENVEREHNLIREKAGVEAELLREQLDKKIVESELLQSQFNPHFLYNTLSAVRWSVISHGDDHTGRILDQLVAFYRATLSSGKPIITLGKEVEMIKNYIDIHRYTSDDAYDFEVEMEPGVEKLFCLKLLLQPFVENAIKHGLGECDRAGTIRVTVRREDGDVVFRVEDNGLGMPPELVRVLNRMNDEAATSALTGYGIFNVIRRIKLFYGEPYGVRYESVENVCTRVTITIPACYDENDRLLFG